MQKKPDYKTNLMNLPDNKKLRYWLEFFIVRGEYNNIREKIVSECMVSDSTLNNWLSCSLLPSPPSQRAINIITEEISGIKLYNNVPQRNRMPRRKRQENSAVGHKSTMP